MNYIHNLVVCMHDVHNARQMISLIYAFESSVFTIHAYYASVRMTLVSTIQISQRAKWLMGVRALGRAWKSCGIAVGSWRSRAYPGPTFPTGVAFGANEYRLEAYA